MLTKRTLSGCFPIPTSSATQLHFVQTTRCTSKNFAHLMRPVCATCLEPLTLRHLRSPFSSAGIIHRLLDPVHLCEDETQDTRVTNDDFRAILFACDLVRVTRAPCLNILLGILGYTIFTSAGLLCRRKHGSCATGLSE
jgi:hypothetical protein